MKYPIYIPSKGRANNQRTVKLLEANNITNYYVVVEKNELEEYRKNSTFTNDPRILSLPGSNYGTSIVARNFCITHSQKLGFDKHWQLDDDISKVYEHNLGKVVHTNLKYIFEQLESLSVIYDSHMIGIKTSASYLGQPSPVVTVNTSLTSFYLIKNCKVKFRGTMLVDMDYQLQLLRKKFRIIRVNKFAFIFKTPTKAPGGYCDIYKNDARRVAAIQEFLKNNPDVDPEMKRSSTGFWVLKNIGKIWRKFK